MATDAEINLKVNIPPPSGADIEKRLADIKRLNEFARDYLKETEKGEGIAKTVQSIRARAEKVGEEVVKRWEAGFADGFKEVVKIPTVQKVLEKWNRNVGADVSKAEADWRAGKISDEQMGNRLQLLEAQQEATYDKASSHKTTVENVEQDLSNNSRMEELLDKHEKFSEALRGEAEGSRALAATMREGAGALEAEAEALDLSIAGNATRKTQLLQQAKVDKERANAAEKAAEIIEYETTAIVKNIASVDDSAEAYEKANKKVDASLRKSLDQKKKLEEVLAKQAVDENKQIENEQKFAEQQARREEREARLAEAAEKREERERYRTELLGKSKLELAKIISELNKQQREAAAIAKETGDYSEVEKIKGKKAEARSAMRQASMQANVTRMMFLQQAQAATRLASNLENVSKGLGGIASAAKNGELNLTGLATSGLELSMAFKAGLGPIAAVMLALTAVQNVVNSYAKDQKKLEELEKKHSDIAKAESDAIWAVKRAREEVAKQRERDNAVLNLKAEHEALNRTLQAGLDLINAQTSAELRRQQLVQDEAQFQRTLKKHELGRALAEGKMSQEEYDLAMLAMNEKETASAADASVSAAKTKFEAAKKKKAQAEKRANEASRRVQEFDGRHMNVSEHEVATYTQELQLLEKKEKEAEEELDAIIYEARNQGVSLSLGAEGVMEVVTFGAYDSKVNRIERQLARAQKNLAAARDAKAKHRQAFKDRAGTTNANEYLAEQRKEKAQLDILTGELKTANAEYEAASKEQQTTERDLAIAEQNADIEKRRAKGMRETQEKNIKTNKKEQKKAEKRQKEINNKTKRLQELTIAELDALTTEFTTSRGKYGDGTKGWTQYNEAILSIKAEKERRQTGGTDLKTAAEIEAMNDRAYKRGGKKEDFEKIDFETIQGTIEDGLLTKAEIQLLEKQMAAATKAQNEVAQELIRTVVAQALNSKKTSEKNRTRIKKLQNEGAL